LPSAAVLSASAASAQRWVRMKVLVPPPGPGRSVSHEQVYRTFDDTELSGELRSSSGKCVPAARAAGLSCCCPRSFTLLPAQRPINQTMAAPTRKVCTPGSPCSLSAMKPTVPAAPSSSATAVSTSFTPAISIISAKPKTPWRSAHRHGQRGLACAEGVSTAPSSPKIFERTALPP